jgi:hypothetical protein
MNEKENYINSPSETISIGGNAFLDESPVGAQSAGAQLLLLATYLLGNDRQRAAIAPDANELAVPPVTPLRDESEMRGSSRLTQYDVDVITTDYRDRLEIEGTRRAEFDSRHQFLMWKNVELTRDPFAAVALLNLSLSSTNELQRVCAASALLALTGRRSRPALSVLEEASFSEDTLVRSIVQTVGHQGAWWANPDDWPEEPVREGADSSSPGPHDETSLAIHGTWDRLNPGGWYKPESDLYSHLTNKVTSNLFQGDGYFRWSGGYSEQQRQLGANDFRPWKAAYGVGTIDTVYAHSHGGNVALNLLANGERIRFLVLLHTPVIYRPDFEWKIIRSNVSRVVVMRTRADLVMLADGLLRGSSLEFDERKLPHTPIRHHWKRKDAWFSHSHFVTLSTWTNYNLAREVNYEHDLALKKHPPRPRRPIRSAIK